MTRLDMVRTAVEELGEQATHAQVDEFVRERFGETIGVKFVPLIRATLRGQEELRKAREAAARIVAEDRARPARGKKAG